MNLSRRNFIKMASLGTTVFLGTYLYSEKPAMAYASNWIKFFDQFTKYMYSERIANSVTEYVNSLPEDSQLGHQIANINSQLAADDYGNLDYSSVYQNVYQNEDYSVNRLYYPLVYNYCGCLYHISPFYNSECGCKPVTYMHSPHMTGVALAAKELKEQNKSQKYVNSVLLPKKGHLLADGNPQKGYDQPLEYSTDKSRVAVDYKPYTPTKGIVAIKVADNEGDELLVNNKWILNIDNTQG